MALIADGRQAVLQWPAGSQQSQYLSKPLLKSGGRLSRQKHLAAPVKYLMTHSGRNLKPKGGT